MAKAPRCPICDRSFNTSTAPPAGAPRPAPPFCSERCKLVDLSRWLGEEYTVSGPSHDPLHASPWLGPDGADTH